MGALRLSTVPGSDPSSTGSARRAISAAVSQWGADPSGGRPPTPGAGGATPAPDTVRIRTLSDTAIALAPNVDAVSAAPAVPEWRTA